jgi:hypothetical protein
MGGDGGGERGGLFGLLGASVDMLFVHDAVADRLREEQLAGAAAVYKREAARDRLHTALMILAYVASFAALAVSVLTAARGVGQTLATDVSYADYLALPADAVCTPATPLLQYRDFAAFAPAALDACRNTGAAALACKGSTQCVNYDASPVVPLSFVEGKLSPLNVRNTHSASAVRLLR